MTEFALTHPFAAALGQPIDGQPALLMALGQDVLRQGKGRDDRYLAAPAKGLEVVTTAADAIKAVFFKAAGVEDFSAYTDALPNHIDFANDRPAVRALLGEPARSGDAGGEGIFAISFAWDRYEDAAHYLRCEYHAGDTAIRMMTIGVLETD
jgi:hypothetical protein